MQPLPRYTLIGMFVVLLLPLTACTEGGGSAIADVPGPPTVTTRTPPPGDDNVSVRDPFVATFSEPVDARTISNSSVIVTGSGSTVLGKTLSLSGNGTTLTIDLSSNPPVPSNLTVAMTNSITDLSGDPLTPPNDAWTLFAPDWLELGDGRTAVEGGTPSRRPSLHVDSSNNYVVAWHESDAEGINIYVQRWNGNSWDSLGAALSANTGRTSARSPSLVVDSADNPVVAWYEYDGTTDNISVQGWNGTTETWEFLGGAALSAIDDDYSPARNPSLAIDSADHLVVAWSEGGELFEGVGSGDKYIFVRRRIGTGWRPLGTVLSAASGPADYPSVAVDGADKPIVAWHESDGSDTHIYVQRWNDTTESWDPLGTALSANPGNASAGNPSLAVDGANNPIVAWQEHDGSIYNIHVQRWDETTRSWASVGGSLSAIGGPTSANSPSLNLDDTGTPVVAWQESDTAVEKVYVRRYNQ